MAIAAIAAMACTVVFAQAAGSTRLGDSTTLANQTDSVAIGNGATTNEPQTPNVDNDGSGGVAVGNNATVNGGSTVNPNTALGYDAKAGGPNGDGISATAVGGHANAEGTDSTAVGRSAAATAIHSTAIGAYAEADQFGATAVGRGSEARATRSSAIGYSAIVGDGANDSIAIGAGTVSNTYDSVAIGSGASTNAPQTPNGAANDGSGAVALGAKATVRGGSYVYPNTALGYAASAGGPNGGAVSATAVGGYANAAELSSVAVGKSAQALGRSSTVVGADAQATGIGGAAFGRQSNAAGQSSTALGWLATASSTQATAVGRSSNASGLNATALGVSTTATTEAATAVGSFSNATGTAASTMGYRSRAEADHSVALGAWSVANRSAGVAGYIPPNADAAQQSAVQATTSTTGAVSVGNDSTGLYRQITGVAAGSADSDAVNVSQLKAVQASVIAAGNQWVTGSPTTYVAPTSSGVDSTAVGSGSVVNADRSVAVGTGANASTANSVALGNASTTSGPVATTGVTIQGQNYTFAGGAPVGVVSVGSQGAERQITNVAAGQISASSTDAVNGSQLYATNQAINNIQAGGGIKYFHANSAAADSQAAGAESVAVGPQAVVGADNGVGMGNGANVSQAALGGVAIGAASSVTQAGGVAIGAGSVASTAAGVAGYVPPTATSAQRQAILATTSTQGGVSVGDAANGQFRQINGVAAGTQDSDAVNVSQLKGVQGQVAEVDKSAVKYVKNVDGTVNYNEATLEGDGGTVVHNVADGVQGNDAVNVNQLKAGVASANAYTDSRLNQMNGRIDNVERNAYAGVAAAMAVQMPAAFVPGKTVMRVGTAAYRGEPAMGVSFRRTAQNNGWSVTGGVGMSRGGAAVTAGVEWVLN